MLVQLRTVSFQDAVKKFFTVVINELTSVLEVSRQEDNKKAPIVQQPCLGESPIPLSQ